MTPHRRRSPNLSLADAFATFETLRDGDCLLWPGATNRKGYGQMFWQGTRRSAHRIAYELANGPIADGLLVDHRCHVPACVNPHHLRLVSNKQNVENHNGSARSLSGVRGVSWAADRQKWRVQVMHHKRAYTRQFDTLAEAEAAAIALRNELFTHNDLDRVAS